MWYHRFVATMVLIHILVLWFFLILILSLLSFYLRRQIGGEWCGFMCCIAAATLWCYLVLSWFKFCCCHALIHHSFAAHKSKFWYWFLWLFDWFFYLKAYAENWFYVPWCPTRILALYMYKFYFAGPFKLKNNNTNKPGICLHQIGGDCWTRCFDVSKFKRKAWRPCCWVCVCCLVVWNLLIHSLRWSKFIWIFNLLKRCVF